MNNYEDWAQLVAKNLKGEGELIAAIDKGELDDAAATEAFTRAVLEPFLPENFGIGQGRVVDAFGNYSDHLDIIIYSRDFPRIDLRGTHSVFLYESVLAVFSIRAKFVRKSFFDALTSCASLAELNANIDKLTLAKLAKKNGLTRDSNNRFVHRDPMSTARFNLIGRPPAFMFGFVGMKQSYRQLQQNIELWIDQRRKSDAEAEMKSLPAVIATQGCFAWRNAAPLALRSRDMLGIGNDSAPIRLIILQLLYILNRRLGLVTDAYGLKPNLKSYLNQFSPPKFEIGVGSVFEVTTLKPASECDQKAMEDAAGQRFEPARDRAAATPSAPKADPAAAPKPASVKAAPPSTSEPVPVKTAEPAPEATPRTDSGVQFESGFKPSTPAPTEADASASEADSPTPFTPPITAPLGSAPIPVDQADDDLPIPEIPSDPEPEDDFAQTVVMSSPNEDKPDENARNSTDAFIAKVKEQLLATDPIQDPDKQKDFNSTVPQ